MAIETRIINGSFTELYTGGGNYMTQAKATHFHSFWTRKILAPTESIDDFKEVTAAERAKLEAADASWERPPQSFIDAWNARADFSERVKNAVFGKYNEDTGYFELNTILDIDYAEAQEIMLQSGRKLQNSYYCELTPISSVPRKVRTLMPVLLGLSYKGTLLQYSIVSGVEVYQLVGYYGLFINYTGETLFRAMSVLHTILGEIRVQGNTTLQTIALKNVKIVSIIKDGYTVNLSSAPLLSLESINYTIENSTKSLALILHADAYARVTDEMFEKAAAKNITITSA